MNCYFNIRTALAVSGFIGMINPGLLCATPAAFNPGEPIMQSYVKRPLSGGASIPPVVMLLMDTSGSMNFNAHQTVDKYGFHTGTKICSDSEKSFYGYFDPEKKYSQVSDTNKDKQYWSESTSGISGSELNCLYMRRIDIARKALTGGKPATAEEITIPEGKTMLRTENGQYILVNKKSVGGMLQAIQSSTALGLTIFDYSGKGGIVRYPISKKPSVKNATDIINTINNITPYGSSPLAESLWTIDGYLSMKKESSTVGPRYYSEGNPKTDEIPEYIINNAWTRFGNVSQIPELIKYSYEINNEWDPFYDAESDERIDCTKKAILIVSDGESMHDTELPANLQDADGDSDTETLPIAMNDELEELRMTTWLDDVAQKINEEHNDRTIYTLFLYGDAPEDPHYYEFPWDGEQLLADAAGKTDGIARKADSGDEIITALQDIMGDLSQSEASGGAVAVASSRGAGAVYQTMYRPLIKKNDTKVQWVGDVQALLTDGYGNLREDTNHNRTVDMVEDKIIKLVYKQGTTSVERYTDSNGNGTLEDEEKAGVETVASDATNWLWSAQTVLDKVSSPQVQSLYKSDGRYLFTSIDDKEIPFAASETNTLEKYLLGSKASLGTRDLNKDGKVDKEDAQMLIDYIRGLDQAKLRPRNVGGKMYRLGDIINSSPVVVQSPADGYDARYNDISYRKFKRHYANRRTMVYVGGNDGIFHAFNGGFFLDSYSDSTNNTYKNKFWKSLDSSGNPSDTGLELGQEMWGYIPQNLLPHLVWLAQEKYDHIYYNDLQPRVFDAKLWGDGDDVHVGGWGTLLVGGMNFGGGPIEVTVNGQVQTMRSAYYILDITDPEQKPVLLSEFTLDSADNFSFTTVKPAVVPLLRQKSGRKYFLKWVLLFGNGPTNLRGESDQEGGLVVYRFNNTISKGQGLAASNNRIWLQKQPTRISLGEEKSFISDPYAVDLQRGNPLTQKGAFTTDAVYFGSTSGSFTDNEKNGGTWSGKMYRLWIAGKEAKALWWIPDWEKKQGLGVLLNTDTPITTRPLMSVDGKGTPWLYFGTGRFLDGADKENRDQQTFYGIKEKGLLTGTYNSSPVDKSDLVDVSKITVPATTADGSPASSAEDAVVSGSSQSTFSELVNEISAKSGWKIDFADTGERAVSNPSIFAGVLLFTSYIPGTGICDTLGNSNIYLRNFTTGTPFWKRILSEKQDKDNSGKIKVHGMVSAASILTGKNGTIKALFKSDDTSISEMEIKTTPLPHKSSRISWKNWFGQE